MIINKLSMRFRSSKTINQGFKNKSNAGIQSQSPFFVAELLSIREIRRPTEFSTDKGLGSTSWRVNLDIPIVFRVATIFPMFHSEDMFRSIFLALVKRLETPKAFSKNFLFLLPTKRETVFALLNYKRQGSEEQRHNRAEKRQLETVT